MSEQGAALGRFSARIGQSCTEKETDPPSAPSALDELTERLTRLVLGEGVRDFFGDGSVWGYRASSPTAPVYAVYEPLLCILAQGSKQVLLGDDRYVYDRRHCLVNTAALPVAFEILEAFPSRPYLSVCIALDPALVRSVIVEAGLHAPTAQQPPRRAISASLITAPLLDSVVRLSRLFDAPPDEAAYLVPLALREIIYRLLTGPHGDRLYASAFLGGQTNRVISAIEWMRANYHKPLRMEALARYCGMSVSALHHCFKSVTAMSPLQFQKQLRLQEAKRLMLSQDLDAAGAGFKVGYDDPSYFSRDYRRFFGDSPRRHIARVRSEVEVS